MTRIRSEHYPKHMKAVGWINRLVIDLKLQIGGHEPSEPITIDRLNEWTKQHARDLERCVINRRIRY